MPSANLIIQNILWLQLIFLIQNLKFGTSVEFEQGFAPQQTHLLQLFHHCTRWFFLPASFPPPSWSPSHGDFGFLVTVHPNDMTRPPQPAVVNFERYIHTIRLLHSSSSVILLGQQIPQILLKEGLDVLLSTIFTTNNSSEISDSSSSPRMVIEDAVEALTYTTRSF